MRTRVLGLIVAVVAAAGAAWLTRRGPSEVEVQTTVPARVPVATDSAQSPSGPVASMVDPQSVAVPPATDPGTADRNELKTLDPEPYAPSGGAVREPEPSAASPSNSVPQVRLPETRPPPVDDRPLRGPETPLPGVPPAVDPTMLPSRPPEDQGATSTR